MTGTFPAAVTTGLESVTGTDGPAKVDDVSTGVATSAAAVDGGEYTVAYHLQTGLTKYAPMQPVPPTKITASNPTPLNPTSAYTIATTYLGKATILTTMTASQTYSVSSIENTVGRPTPTEWDNNIDTIVTGCCRIPTDRRHEEVFEQVEGLEEKLLITIRYYGWILMLMGISA